MKMMHGTSAQDEETYSYIDYIISEKNYKQSKKYEADCIYWNEVFKTIPEQATIPSTKKTQKSISSTAAREVYTLDTETVKSIKSICSKNKISVFNFLMSIYSIYLSRVSNQNDFVIGTPILNRSNFKEKQTMGMFVNTVPVRITMPESATFIDFARSLGTQMLGILKHQKYSYTQILEDLRNKNPNVTNLYNILISYQITKAYNSDIGNYETAWIFNNNSENDINIHITDINDTGNLQVSYDYQIEKYGQKDIEKMHERIINIIGKILETPETLLTQVETATNHEKEIILKTFNNTAAPQYPLNKTVIELFEEQVEKTPKNIAIECQGEEITYEEFNKKANQLAHFLRKKGIGRNDLVAIVALRSIEMMIGIWGIIKAGAAYVPIDPNYPQERIDHILTDSNPKVVLLANADITTNKTKIDICKEPYNDESTENPQHINTPEDSIYCIYTSGTTGKPKGVVNKHVGLINRIWWMDDLYPIKQGDVVLQKTTYCFDVSVWELVWWGFKGAKLSMLKVDGEKEPKEILEAIEKNEITTIHFVPSMLNMMLVYLEKIPTNELKDKLKTLKYVFTSGEELKKKQVEKFNEKIKKANPKVRLINVYGPTEASIDVTYYECQDQNDIIPIGKPISNIQMYILDRDSTNLCGIGILGEICIGGVGVAKGYLNREELNKEKFIDNPYHEGKIYRTGDLGRWLEDGNIEYAGRIDHQVKIRGMRIELGEIEDKLNEIPYIKSSVVVKKTDNQSHEFLCAYFTASKKTDVREIKSQLEKFLPRYMIPTYYSQLDDLPHNPNGKIDRKRLPEPQLTQIEKSIIKPKNEEEEIIIEILGSILNLDKNQISTEDNFFDLGGDSLSAINLCIQVQSKFQKQLSVKDVIDNPIVAQMAKTITNLDNIDYSAIKPIPKAEYYEVSSAQERMYFVSQIVGENSILYNVPGGIILDKDIDLNLLEQCINKVIQRQESLRTYFEQKNEKVIQKVLEKIDFKLGIEQNREYQDIDDIFNNFVKPFNLSEAPLFRAKLIKFTNQKTALFIDMHHIIADGASLSILVDEICKLYNGESLPELEVSYKDFAAYENKKIASGNLKEAEEYWVNQFENDIPVLNMPTIGQRPAIQSHEGRKVYSLIDASKTHKIGELSKQLGITPYMFLLSCYGILLSKYTSQKDIIIGTPVAGRENLEVHNLIGMFVNTLALRTNINERLSIEELILQIKEKVLQAYKYQAYPFDKLVSKLNLKRDPSRNPIFDTMFTYQNDGYKDVNFAGTKYEYYIPDMKISKFDLSVEAVPSNNEIKLSFEYATKLFEEQFIKKLSEHYQNIIDKALENLETQISDISILSTEEENKILYEFNDTKNEYPKDKTIIELFESQVEASPEKIAVVFEDKKLTYRQLNDKANSLANYLRNTVKINRNDLVGIMVNRSIEMMVAIIAVLKAGGAYIPIDPSYPKERVDYMLKTSRSKILLTKSNLKDQIEFKNKIIVDLENSDIYTLPTENLKPVSKPDDLSYVIFTSGSTGTPKGVMLTHKALTNLTNYCNNYIEYLKNPTYQAVVSTTTVSFDIFIFETLISLQKGLKLVIANEDEQNTPMALNKLIAKHNVKIIQATPSRMQLFLNNKDQMAALRNLKYITLAGEQLPLNLVRTLKELYGVTIYNGYGPSETTVFSTLTKMTDDRITIGKPLDNTQIYILNDYIKPVPIGVTGEIYISGDGVGRGYLNNAELTKQSFIPNPFKKGTIMYKTGDLGFFQDDGDIICLGRSDNQVKIRGLRIELGEIEDQINKLEGINSCTVIKKIDQNSREYICAYYTSQKKIEPSRIKKEIGEFLPQYMIPQYFMQLENMPYTPNGKIDRKKLPEPRIITNENKKILKPRNDTDQRLLAMYQDILNIKEISIDDNFFDIGGDSLTAINLCIRIQNELNKKIFAKDILENPTIETLSDFVSSKHSEDLVERIVINRVKEAEYYKTSSAQKRIYFANQVAGENSILYNIPYSIILDGTIDSKKLEDSIKTLIERHESLRTYFELEQEMVVQKYKKNIEWKLETIENADFEKKDTIFSALITPFDLSKAPLFRVKLINFTNGKSALFIDIHHIISDGASLSILAKEISKLYNDKRMSKLKITYKDWAEFENNLLENNKMQEAEEYWTHKLSGELPVLNMPIKAQRPAVQSFEGKRISSKIDASYTRKINRIAKKLGLTPYMLLIACYNILLSKYTSQDEIIVGSPIVGRDMEETSGIVGMFVNTLAIRTNISNKETFKEFTLKIKESILNAYKYQIYPFDELVSKLNIKRDTSRNPIFDTMFIYQNNNYKDIEFGEIKGEYYIPQTNISKFDLSVEAVPQNGEINLSFEYATKLFDQEFIKLLSEHYLNILKAVIEDVDIKIEDIDILSEEERNKIIYEFNDTAQDYDRAKTVTQLFEEQAKETPDNIAVVFQNQELTYKKLNEKANSLAYYLRNEVKIGPNDIVGIMVKRSVEMIVAILAVLKAGGAYIPIDPSFPKDRVDYMLKSSQAKILLTQKKLEDTIQFDNKLEIDLNNRKLYENPSKDLENINNPEDLGYIIFTSGSTGLPKGVMITHRVLSNFTNYCNNYVEYLKNPENQAIVSITTVSFDIFFYETIISLQKGLKVVIANDDEQNTPNLLNNLMEKHDVKIIQTTPSRMQIFVNNIENIPSIQNVKYVILAGEQLPLTLLNALHELGDITVYNGYGPSETYYSTLVKMDKDFITIGKPIYNSQMYILDNNLKPVPIGVSGEIYISGECVGKGYLNNEELSKKSFIPDPFIPDTIMYKTGDLGYYTEDGNIICQGRSDHQVKIRGLRIELEEIESLILKYPNIKKTVVVKQTVDTREFISAYFVADKNIDINDLRKQLSKRLPRYMVPSYFIALEDLPYTPNGKIDRKSLPLSKEILSISKEEYVAPKTEIQKQLVTIWEKLLNAKPIGINDNFFELGGDSLLAMNLNIEILNISKNITYSDIFRYPTIAELEEKINSKENKLLFSKIENLSDNFVDVLKDCTKKDKQNRYRPRNILITGATGFLGIHILEEYIRKEKGNVYCIVRESPGVTARTKLHQKLSYYFGNKYDELIDKRIFAVTGDTSKPGFGITQDELLLLANSVDVVINSAANVAHFGNYSDFYKANVTSVKYIIDFCKSFNKKLYHVSTIGVAGTKLDKSSPFVGTKFKKVKFDESSLYVGQILDGVYVRSKFEAETFVLNAIKEGLDGYILRMGHLSNRYKDGLFQENAADNELLLKISSFAKIGAVPEYLLDYKFYLTPVDSAAKAIYKLITHPSNKNRVFNLYNQNSTTTQRLIKVFTRKNKSIQILPEKEFIEKINAILADDNTKNLLKNLIDDFDNNLHLDYDIDIIFKADFTIKYLRKTGFWWPRISNKYLNRYIKLIRDTR